MSELNRQDRPAAESVIATIKNCAIEIREKCAARERAEQGIERMEALARSAHEHEAEIADLKQRLQTIVARTLIEGGKADTTEIDREIARREKSAAAAFATTDAIPKALEILRDEVASRDDEIVDLVQQQRRAARALIDERHAAAERRYIDAAIALGGALVEMAAIERLRNNHVLQDGTWTPSNAISLLVDLRERTPLKVPHSISWYACDALWPHGAPNVNEAEWSKPVWLADHPIGQLAPELEAERSISDELRELGIDM